MEENKKLMIAISNKPTYHGNISLNFAIDYFGKKHSENEVLITIFELCDDESVKAILERKNGLWEDLNVS